MCCRNLPILCPIVKKKLFSETKNPGTQSNKEFLCNLHREAVLEIRFGNSGISEIFGILSSGVHGEVQVIKYHPWYMWLPSAFHHPERPFLSETLINIEITLKEVHGSPLRVFLFSFLCRTSQTTHSLDSARGNPNKTRDCRVLSHSTEAKPQND